MHKNIVGQAHKLRGKRKCTDLEVGDLVLEVTNIAGPLQTGLKGPFKIVSINDTKPIAVLETGQTRFIERKYFKRHTSHLVKYHEPLRDWGGGECILPGITNLHFPLSIFLKTITKQPSCSMKYLTRWSWGIWWSWNTDMWGQ
eukprot:jgi/Botrbrau1/14300/Bobra.0207s0005.1